jgi:Vam6/Vps39-like protein vacuolar protein sorting-associated protein 39
LRFSDARLSESGRVCMLTFPKDHVLTPDRYCNQVYLSEAASSAPHSPTSQAPITDPEDTEPSIYNTLLSLYLKPPPPHKTNWPPALDLLSRHGARLPASLTLDLIPATLPVKELESYFRGRIRSATSVTNEERIVSRLCGVEKVETEAALLLGDGQLGGNGGRSRKVVVDEDRHCPVCQKRFGGSAIRVYPDNTIVHYGCFNKATASPKSRKDESRRSIWG